MLESILVAGSTEFNQSVKQRLGYHTMDFITNSISEQSLDQNLYSIDQPLSQVQIVFLDSEPELIPFAEKALRQSKHLVLFGSEKSTLAQLKELLNLSVESKSILLNGDSLLFNPVVYPMLTYFETTEITTLTSNRFRRYLSRRSVFQCIELLLYTNQSPLKQCFAKAIKLSGERINVLHIRFEFENESLAVLEMSNCKPTTKLYIESAGKGNWMSLDLLTFNGQYYHYDDDETVEVSPPKQVYPTERNSMNQMFDFMETVLKKSINPHKQFENTIQTAKAIETIEEQLRRSLPKFGGFED